MHAAQCAQSAVCIAFAPGRAVLVVGTAAPSLQIWSLKSPCCTRCPFPRLDTLDIFHVKRDGGASTSQSRACQCTAYGCWGVLLKLPSGWGTRRDIPPMLAAGDSNPLTVFERTSNLTPIMYLSAKSVIPFPCLLPPGVSTFPRTWHGAGSAATPALCKLPASPGRNCPRTKLQQRLWASPRRRRSCQSRSCRWRADSSSSGWRMGSWCCGMVRCAYI